MTDYISQERRKSGMTVEMLKELLEETPDDADVKFRDSLIGDDHDVEAVKYDEKKNVLWLLETLY